MFPKAFPAVVATVYAVLMAIGLFVSHGSPPEASTPASAPAAAETASG